MSNNEEYEEILIRMHVNGTNKGNPEYEWARDAALKVNHWLYVFTTKHPKLYKKIVLTDAQWKYVCKCLMIFAKGYNFKTRRKVIYNPFYTIKPGKIGKSTHYIDDMIYVKDFGE